MTSAATPPKPVVKRHRIRRFFVRSLLLALVLVLVFVSGSMIWSWRDNRLAQLTTNGPYTADLDSLRKHPLPQWFADAKFGVMIHWGLYSVPGFAPKGTTFNRLLQTDYDRAMTRNPYAEDYANALKDPDSPTARFHREHYGDAPYSDFTRQFDAGLARWDPDRWAEQFQAAGASYVVVTAKYADGYSLWPTEVRNPHAPDFHARRDLMGELAAAVRKRGLKFGVYYSGGVDWTFQPQVVKTLGDYAFLPYGEDYRRYAVDQVRELIKRYKPDILWNDIAWPTGSKRLYALLADYYNTVPDGVVDDRWSTASFGRQVLGVKPVRWGFDQMMKVALSTEEGAGSISTPKDVPHSDFRTPEYTGFDTVQPKFWQQDRGIGGSFGYNREETDADYAPTSELIAELAGAAANNGALMLNVGPSGGEGAIVPEQAARLAGIGAWLRTNREAMHGTRPWTRSSAVTATGDKVVFTTRGNDLYVVVLGRPKGDIVIKDLTLHGRATTLAGAAIPVTIDKGATVLKASADGSYAPVFKFSGGAGH
ncbi:alpha-L-fucosidase [Kribbella sp. ALI-6-A]|uniref:alpha-L-fucosidase n=1 Tax=Kribbella sp. ALI-6-A TaxID=1933817 RepID=UPI00143DE048|nr:alpha-L-fucosidase [Kribbella sp. ALI-6-A]